MFKRKLACSFCRRSEAEVAKLVAGPRVYICDRCAADVMRIMNEADHKEEHSRPIDHEHTNDNHEDTRARRHEDEILKHDDTTSTMTRWKYLRNQGLGAAPNDQAIRDGIASVV